MDLNNNISMGDYDKHLDNVNELHKEKCSFCKEKKENTVKSNVLQEYFCDECLTQVSYIDLKNYFQDTDTMGDFLRELSKYIQDLQNKNLYQMKENSNFEEYKNRSENYSFSNPETQIKRWERDITDRVIQLQQFCNQFPNATIEDIITGIPDHVLLAIKQRNSINAPNLLDSLLLHDPTPQFPYKWMRLSSSKFNMTLELRGPKRNVIID